MTNTLEDLEREMRELEQIVVGDEPSTDYEHGFRDGIQHGVVAAREVLDE